MQHEEKANRFKLITGHMPNWKESISVEHENLTGNPNFDKLVQESAEKDFETFVYFCGGAERKVISPSKIIITTKGYYFYIGS